MKQFEIWQANLPCIPGSHVQYGCRPVVVVSNDAANAHSPVVTVVPLTTRRNKHHLPTHVYLQNHGLGCGSIALCEQILSVDKSCLARRLGMVYDAFGRLAIRHALAMQLAMAA